MAKRKVKIDQNESIETVKKEINIKLLESLKNYKNIISMMFGDAPLGVLCLPKTIEKILSENGVLRVYDLFNRDLFKIEGLSDSARGNLTSRLDQFISMSK